MPPAFLFLIPAMSNSWAGARFRRLELGAPSTGRGGLYSRRILRQHLFFDFLQSNFSELKNPVFEPKSHPEPFDRPQLSEAFP